MRGVQRRRDWFQHWNSHTLNGRRSEARSMPVLIFRTELKLEAHAGCIQARKIDYRTVYKFMSAAERKNIRVLVSNW